MRRFASISALIVVASLAAPTAQAAEAIEVGPIGADDPIFWEGGDVGWSPLYSIPSSPNLPVDRCSIDGHPCFVYSLTTTATGERLRIGFDTPMRDDTFNVTIETPGGESSSFVNSNQYSRETFIGNPAIGTYTITVVPVSAEYAHFRMRALIESVAYKPTPNPDGELLPDIAVTRLWEFGFAAPANPLNGLFPPDDVNPPLTAAGVTPLSCAGDEIVEEGAERCLRYSFGMANLGDGAFRVRHGANPTQDTAAVQCIEMADGSMRSKPAGSASYHKTHGHVHYNDFILHELFRVTDADTGAMESVGNGKKLGYSPADQGMPEWQRFDQAASGTSSQAAGNCAPEYGSSLGMSRGWGDSYRYQRPGNYVELGTNGDGSYVVQTIGDPLDLIAETNEDNNVAYAYVQILGEQIRVIETGRGTSPWDPSKTLFDQ